MKKLILLISWVLFKNTIRLRDGKLRNGEQHLIVLGIVASLTSQFNIYTMANQILTANSLTKKFMTTFQ